MLDKSLAPHAGRVYALTRLMAGLLFTFHGVQKIFGVMTTNPVPDLGTQLWIGGLLELVCGGLIAIGLFTRYAAFIASGMMAVAYAQFHWKFQFDHMAWPANNGGELALVYSLLFLFIACQGNKVKVDSKKK